MVDVAKAVGADAVSHGCTGKGNDQVIIAFGHKSLIQVQCWLHNIERIGHKLILPQVASANPPLSIMIEAKLGTKIAQWGANFACG
jgi:hypothetical protein